MPAVRSAKFTFVAMLCLVLAAPVAVAGKKTVCSITVNSSDEREMFKRHLPHDEFDFVELVERGRPDWLASSCHAGVTCDILLISGHFDGGTEFYTDRLDQREYLPVIEMERAACSASCPGLFSQLKEVYLFGCNTLDAGALQTASAEIVRSLVRAGYSASDAERLARTLGELHAESNRDHMRDIFKDVPVIYGFSGKAPLGKVAGPLLERYFQSGPSEIGSGRASSRLLSLFAPTSMTVTAGPDEGDSRAGFRRDACHFSDDRLAAAQKIGFIHEFMRRDMAEVRLFLHHLERYMASLGADERGTPSVSAALREISGDTATRARYLAFARDADEPAVRARMFALAEDLGWLTQAEVRQEVMQMFGERIAQGRVDAADVNLACALNQDQRYASELYASELPRLHAANAQDTTVSDAALFACLGSADGHARMLRALSSGSADDVQIAQVYLHHRQVTDVDEMRMVASGIARMTASDAQVRALNTLARQPPSDRESLQALVRLFPVARTLDVQRAIAGVLIRADRSALAKPELVVALRKTRLKSPDGSDMIDVLIRQLQAN